MAKKGYKSHLEAEITQNKQAAPKAACFFVSQIEENDQCGGF